jgi:hypothetical protein
MSEPFLSVTLAELQARGIVLTAEDAVAVVTLVGDSLHWSAAPPTPDNIVLRSDGRVEARHPRENTLVTAADYAALLHQLLPEPGGARSRPVHGGVRILVARALGQTDLPPIVWPQQFAKTLARFAPSNTSELIVGLLVRWADVAAQHRPAPARTERRHSGPGVTHLRLALREADLERYALRQRLSEATRSAADTGSCSGMDPEERVRRVAEIRLVVSDTGHEIRRDAIASHAGALQAATESASVDDAGQSSFVPIPRTSAVTRVGTLAVIVLLLGLAIAIWRLPGSQRQSGTAAISVPARRPTTSVAPRSGSRGSASEKAISQGTSLPIRPHKDTAGDEAALSEVATPLRAAAPSYSPAFGTTAHELLFHADDRDGSRLLRATTNQLGAVEGVQTLVHDAGRAYHVRLSPDGSRLAYDSDRDGQRGVYVGPRDGTLARRVSGPGYAAIPTWSPDGQQLAFIRAEQAHPRVWNLWLLNLRSGRHRRLTRYAYGQTWTGSWFPDGTRVAYTHERSLHVMNVASGVQRTFGSPVPGRLVRTAAVAPDGRHVLFQVRRDGAWLLDLITGRTTRVLDDPSAEEFTWSPDGQHVAYHSHRSGRWEVWTMPSPIPRQVR